MAVQLSPSPSRSDALRFDLRWARLAPAAGVFGLAALLIGLITEPRTTLPLFWNVVVPLLPASFLASPHLWRATCPLATLGRWRNGVIGRWPATGKFAGRSEWVSVALLFGLVPARHVWFNQDAAAAVGLLLVVMVAAVLLGTAFDAKAGFCNTMCPVQAVERLYGQAPMISLSAARCSPCSACLRSSCLDLGTRRWIASTRQAGRVWLVTAPGVMIGAFPGLVLGYGLTRDVAPGQGLEVYGRVLLLAGLSWMLCVGVVRLYRIGMARAALLSGLTAVSLYYWFASVSITSTLGGGAGLMWSLRVLAAALIAWWFAGARVEANQSGVTF